MKILFDECVPRPLRRFLPGNEIKTVQEMGWGRVKNGDLLALAEPDFELLLTSDKNVRYQQNLTGRTIAIIILPTNDWTIIGPHAASIGAAIARIRRGDFYELSF